MEKKKILLLVVLLVVVLAVAGWGYQVLSERYEPEDALRVPELGNGSTETADQNSGEDDGEEAAEKVAAPDFIVYDEDGNVVNLSDYLGKPVLVNFWASWCGPCKMEMPYFQTAYEAYGEEIEFLMVNVTDGSQETQEKAEAFLAELGYDFPVYFDKDLNASATYGVSSIPATLAVDAEGYVVTGYVGTLNEAQVEVLTSVLRGEE